MILFAIMPTGIDFYIEQGGLFMGNDPISILTEHLPSEAKAKLDQMADEVLDECMQKGVLADFFAGLPDAAELIKTEILHAYLEDAYVERERETANAILKDGKQDG